MGVPFLISKALIAPCSGKVEPLFVNMDIIDSNKNSTHFRQLSEVMAVIKQLGCSHRLTLFSFSCRMLLGIANISCSATNCTPLCKGNMGNPSYLKGKVLGPPP